MSTPKPGSPEWLREFAAWAEGLELIESAGLRAAAEQLEALAKTATDAVKLAHVYRESAEKAEAELFTASQTILRVEAERDRLREALQRLIDWGPMHDSYASDATVRRYTKDFHAAEAAIDAARKEQP
jgi:hypothetical protein